jgi:hypothetical protein
VRDVGVWRYALGDEDAVRLHARGLTFLSELDEDSLVRTPCSCCCVLLMHRSELISPARVPVDCDV